jgi:hypothetical protein
MITMFVYSGIPIYKQANKQVKNITLTQLFCKPKNQQRRKRRKGWNTVAIALTKAWFGQFH